MRDSSFVDVLKGIEALLELLLRCVEVPEILDVLNLVV